jgi:DnaJ-class molecular chaperone
MPVQECPECDGTGALVSTHGWATYYERCPKCDGTGIAVSFDDDEDDLPHA